MSILWNENQGFQVLISCFGIFALKDENTRQMLAGLDRLWIELNRATKKCFCLGISLLLLPDSSKKCQSRFFVGIRGKSVPNDLFRGTDVATFYFRTCR